MSACWATRWPSVFPHGSAVGEAVNYHGINYSVVGVLESQGRMQGGQQDNFAVIPITTGLSRYGSAMDQLQHPGPGGQPG